MARTLRRLAPLLRKIAPVAWKQHNELEYWKARKREEGDLTNAHYRHFFTTHFGFDDDFYRDKVIVDIGCGPRGSLEWATTARRRIGVDPLADRYSELHASAHAMEYIAAPAESIPLDDASCDVVSSFNSLDHVRDVPKTIAEIKRVTKPGGYLLLLVEVGHLPTDTEPHTLDAQRIITSFAPDFVCETMNLLAKTATGMYDSIAAGVEGSDYLSAKFVRQRDVL